MNLSKEDKQLLLGLAHNTIASNLAGNTVEPPLSSSPILNEKLGVFVTLHLHGELRGCIGYVEGVSPLIEAVSEMSAAAAFRDPRFEPVTATELDELEFEISVLSPLKSIESIDEIIVGKHGLIISKGYMSGLLLPQVATEYGWDSRSFLEHTCRKAGLPVNAWKDKETTIKIFSAEIFSDDSI